MALQGISNLSSMTSQIALNSVHGSLTQSIERLSTGLQINSAFDDPSGYSISEKMRGYITGLQSATDNAQNGSSMLETAEGAMGQVNDILSRMRELAVQASNGTYTSTDISEIQKEVDQLKEEVDRIAETTEYNSIKLLDGSTTGVTNASSSSIGAVITGSVESGNYDINVSVSQLGETEIQKSQILSVKEDSIAAYIESEGTTGAVSVSFPEGFDDTEDVIITVGDSEGVNDYLSVNSSYKDASSSFEVTTATATVDSNESGYMLIQFTETTENGISGSTTAKVKFYSAETGEEGAWIETTVDELLNGFTYQNSGFDVEVSLEISTGTSVSATIGDMVMLNITDVKGITASGTLAASGGGTLQLNSGPVVYFDGQNSLTSADNKDGIEDTTSVALYEYSLDSDTGQVNAASITIDLAENTPFGSNSTVGVTQTGIITIDIRGEGEAATSTTQLSDIASFYDSNGIFIFENTQELTIYGNGTSATIYIEGSDTIADLEAKLNSALVDDLDMGSGNTGTDKNLVDFVEVGSDDFGINSTAGAFILQTAMAGESGEVSIIASQDVLNALGFSVIKESTDSLREITVTDSETGVIIGSTLSSSDRVSGLISGVDVLVDARTGVTSSYNATTGEIEFSESNRLEDTNLSLHIVDTRTEIQVGTLENEKIDISIPQIDTVALGIDTLVLNTQEDAQKAITTIDAAIDTILSIRGEIGAKINRLDTCTSILEETSTNMTAAESRIRDLDIASETAAYSTNQVLYQSTMTMLAQANQMPSMMLELIGK